MQFAFVNAAYVGAWSVLGPISSVVGVTETLVGASAVIVAATLLVLLIPDVRTLRRHEAAASP